ncbi:BLUF domain-containing protein [Neptuniibacter sp. SY11_33]|uniref:BLUF domain-containing protein n=1 Tax=Neptuniibacter sp. SY11_33 TaxID=3398215 RepID=UPI0039F6482C
MELIHCIYCSAATDSDLTKEALDEILEQSRTNNQKSDITGILLFESGAFFQVLEGDRDAIEKAYLKISRDPRHERVTKLISEPIEERAFGEWSMGYPRVTKKELEEISGLNDFFARGNSFMELEEGRAKVLLQAFKQGQWHL